MSILNVEHLNHCFGDRAILKDVSFRLLKGELKRALMAYKGSILLICHEPVNYEDIVNNIWNCEEWTTRAI